jgi:hypothetical protein
VTSNLEELKYHSKIELHMLSASALNGIEGLILCSCNIFPKEEAPIATE